MIAHFCLIVVGIATIFNGITLIRQHKQIEKLQFIVEALRHEIQTTQEYMEQMNEKVNGRQD